MFGDIFEDVSWLTIELSANGVEVEFDIQSVIPYYILKGPKMTDDAMLTARVPAETKELAANNLTQMGYTASLAIQAIWKYLASAPIEDGKRFLEPAMRREESALEKRKELLARSKSLVLTREKYKDLFGVELDLSADFAPVDQLEAEREQRYMKKYYGSGC